MIDREAKVLSNSLIAFDTDEARLEKLQDKIISFLRSKHILAMPTDRPFHVSVSYISNAQEESDLLGLMEQAEGAGRFHGRKLVPLQGKNGKTYLALQVEASPKFFNFKRKVDGKTKAQGFAHGFKAHVSLVKFPSALMESTLIEELNSFLNPVFSINSDRVLLFDQSHKVYRSMEASLELIEHLEAKNRMSRKAMETLMRRILDRHTKGVFSDAHWKPVHDIQKDFDAEMIDITLIKSEYYRAKEGYGSSDEPAGKSWDFEVPFQKGGWRLRLIASFGPSPMNDPMSRYDLIYTLNWDGRMKSASSRLREVSAKIRSL